MKATNAPVLRKTSAVKKCSLRLRYMCGIHARGSAVSRSNTETRHQSLDNTSIHTRRGCIWVSWCMVGCYCDAAAFLSVFTPSTSRWIVVRFSNLFVAVLSSRSAISSWLTESVDDSRVWYLHVQSTIPNIRLFVQAGSHCNIMPRNGTGFFCLQRPVPRPPVVLPPNVS